MVKTDNYDLIVVEGSDKVNLLTQMNPNTTKIDEQMKKNENSGIHVATELLSGSVHAITRTVPTASMFKFTAVSNYTAGDTFTVDGIQVTALLTSGEALGNGAYIIGSEVLCSLKDTLLTVYTNGGTALLADDSEKLGGNLPEYYAKQSDLTQVSGVANSASDLSRQNSSSITLINDSLSEIRNQIAKRLVNTTYGMSYTDIAWVIDLSTNGYGIYILTNTGDYPTITHGAFIIYYTKAGVDFFELTPAKNCNIRMSGYTVGLYYGATEGSDNEHVCVYKLMEWN